MELDEVRSSEVWWDSVRYWPPVFATGAAFFMIVLDTSIVNLALPRIGAEFHAGVAPLQWLVDGYAMIFASLLLSAGAIGDRVGVKGTFLTGLAVFTIASGLCGVAATMAGLQISRIVQGVGAALLLPNSLAAINGTFLNPIQRSKAIGAWASAGAVGIAIGPVLGGFLVQILGWRSIFVVNIPVGLIAMWMTYIYVPKAERHASRPLDILGQLLAVGTLATLTYGLIAIGRPASRSIGLWIPGAGYVFLAGMFVLVEMRQRNPMLPLKLLLIRRLGPVSLVGLLHNVSIYGLIFVLSLKFQRLWGLTPIIAGTLFLPMTVALAAGTRIGTKLLKSQGAFELLIWGHFAAGMGVLLLLASGNQMFRLILAGPLVVIGLGAGVTTPAMGLAVLDSVARSQGGLAAGILNSARQAGGVIGVAVLGALLGDPVSPFGVSSAECVAAAGLFSASALAFVASGG